MPTFSTAAHTNSKTKQCCRSVYAERCCLGSIDGMNIGQMMTNGHSAELFCSLGVVFSRAAVRHHSACCVLITVVHTASPIVGYTRLLHWFTRRCVHSRAHCQPHNGVQQALAFHVHSTQGSNAPVVLTTGICDGCCQWPPMATNVVAMFIFGICHNVPGSLGCTCARAPLQSNPFAPQRTARYAAKQVDLILPLEFHTATIGTSDWNSYVSYRALCGLLRGLLLHGVPPVKV